MNERMLADVHRWCRWSSTQKMWHFTGHLLNPKFCWFRCFDPFFKLSCWIAILACEIPKRFERKPSPAAQPIPPKPAKINHLPLPSLVRCSSWPDWSKIGGFWSYRKPFFPRFWSYRKPFFPGQSMEILVFFADMIQAELQLPTARTSLENGKTSCKKHSTEPLKLGQAKVQNRRAALICVAEPYIDIIIVDI